jgi:hypothetical protein
MYGLIKVLYDEPKQRAFEMLYLDSDDQDRLLLRATIAEALKDCPRLLPSNGTDWILCTLSSYHKSNDDTLRVFQALMRKIERIQFGLLTADIKWKEMNDVADDCLVGLSFFRRRMELLHQKRAAPSPDYYREAGALAFKRLGFDEISNNFEGWVSFIEKEFIV